MELSARKVTPMIGNEYTADGTILYIDFTEPVKGVIVRRHVVFANFKHSGAAMRVARLLNYDEAQRLDAIENPVFEMELGESLIDCRMK